MKKFLCLCVVLILASPASAAISWWKNYAAGDWETATNWSVIPSGSTTAGSYNSAGGKSVITVTTGGTAYKIYMVGAGTYPASATDATIIVNDGATLNVTRDVYMYSTVAGSKSTITINAGGVMNAVTADASYQFIMTGNLTGVKSTDTVNVSGTLNIGGTGTAVSLKVGDTGTSTGNAVVNIYSGGIVNTQPYTIRTTTTNPGHIYLENCGWMWINGNKTANVAADIAAGRIAAMALPGTTGLEYGYDSVKGKTWIHGIPEPATVALLGLGGLLLCRKRKKR